MFSNNRFKKVLVLSIILVLVLSTIAIAANEVYQKKLTATIGRIKLKVDGKDVTKEIEEKYKAPPFVVKEFDSRSYIPVRAIAELMGMEVNWDDETHTAEIIDVKSKAYEEEIKKKDKEIAELKKEIKKLKEEVVEEDKLQVLEDKLNDKYGTYKDVNFDIVLKESKNNIDVEIIIDLKDYKQENAWNKMGVSTKKAMLEDIVDIISKEYTDYNIHGSIYDLYYKKELFTFNKPKIGKLSITHDNKYIGGSYDSYIDEVVYDEFYYYGIKDVYMSNLNIDRYNIYFDINIPYGYRSEWRSLSKMEKEDILDRISNKIIYNYDYYYDYIYKDVRIRVYVDGEYQGQYTRYYNESTGNFN